MVWKYEESETKSPITAAITSLSGDRYRGGGGDAD